MCEKKQKIILMLLLSVMCTLGAQDLVHLKLKATRYHSMFENRRTSNGDIFSSKKYTAAHKNIKLGTFVLVVDTVTDKWVVVKINDRCPRKNVIDLSGIAADRIGLTLHKGVARVLVTILPDEAEAIWLQQESMHDKYDKI
ncbi:MAG: septal ring lytic transglycosylase RlpA family protein, partial [Bacteroidales bacterium]|nr:septal ring lytic transglycosylase RlpA family protein [Bacteroidales bacterium]